MLTQKRIPCTYGTQFQTQCIPGSYIIRQITRRESWILHSFNKHLPSAHCVLGTMTSSALLVQTEKKNQCIQARKAIRGEVNVYKAVANEYSESAEYNYSAPEQYRDDNFCYTFYYGFGFKHPLKTHEMEAEDGSVLKSTVCSCRKHGTGSQNPQGSSQFLVTFVPGDPAALFCPPRTVDMHIMEHTHTYVHVSTHAYT